MVRVETGGIILDLFQDESVELELSVNNVRDIGKIYAPISKTFTVPASDRNNQYFKHYYDVNVDGGFNAYVRTPAQLFVDSEQIFAGYLELLDCIIENDEPKQYEILVASAAPSLAKTLEAKKIDALNLPSVTDVPFTISEIAASWIGDSDIRFGLVDRRGLLAGDGSFSALSSGDPVYEADFMPYMRLPTIVKGIIEENGYRYSSTFLDNDIDDVYLMLGRNGGILSDAEVLSSKMIDVSGATNGTAVNYTFGVLSIDEPRWNQLSFGTEIQDPSSQYNPATSTFTPSVAGDYKFQISGQASQPTRALDFVMISDAEAATNDPFTSNQVQTSQIFTFGTNNTGAFNFNVELPLLANTAYKFYIRVSTANTASIPITNSQLTIVDVPLNPAGATLDFTSLLPDVTQKQFISEVARLYNLVFVPDRYDDKLIHIQPYDDWIASGSLFNLTEYVDIAKPISVKPTTSIQSRSLAFNMAEGEDELSQKHIKQFGITHSSVEISDTGNEFAEGETKIESEFVNTLIVRDSTSLIQFPIIADENFESVDIGLRLAFWNGTSPSPTWYFESTLTNTQSVFSPFPQLQPYNDYENPTFNLGFAPPAVASGINIPTDNLFTDYWENYIGNIYDSDSRLVELEAHIPASVLNTLELNDSVIYKNQGYYIQRFTYDTLTERAKIELLKAVRTNPVICNLTPSPTNIIDFRGAVNFVDADGNITQDATENCCNFYGYTWNGKNGKCYLKFDRPPSTSKPVTRPTRPDPKPIDGDPTQSKPLVSIYNPITKKYEYVLPSDLGTGAESLNDLTDVDAASNKNDGAIMQWSSALNSFVLSNNLDLLIEGSDLFADNSPTAGQVYQYNGTTFQWATVTSGGVTSLNDIGDVSVPSPSTNDVLTWNGSTWVASASGGGSADGVVNGATFIGGLLALQRSLGLPDVSVNLDGRYLLSTHPASGVTTAGIAEWDAAYANIISGLTFDSLSGNLTATRPQGGNFVANLDGRYLDDGKEVTSIAFSGTTTKTLTMTFADASTLTASFTDSGGGGVADGVVNGATFNTSNGELTLTRTESLPDVVVDLDGRYSTFSGFSVKGDLGSNDFIGSGQVVTFSGGTGITTQSNATNNQIDIWIPDNSITEAMLIDGVVTNAKLADLAVTEGKIASNAVTTSKINDLAVTNAKLANDTISEPKLDIHNNPTDGYVLQHTAANGMEWVEPIRQSRDTNPSQSPFLFTHTGFTQNTTTSNTARAGDLAKASGTFTVASAGSGSISASINFPYGASSSGLVKVSIVQTDSLGALKQEFLTVATLSSSATGVSNLSIYKDLAAAPLGATQLVVGDKIYWSYEFIIN